MIVHLSIDPGVYNWPGLDQTLTDVENVSTSYTNNELTTVLFEWIS